MQTYLPHPDYMAVPDPVRLDKQTVRALDNGYRT